MAKILITGAAGFIGSNFARYWLEHHTEDEVIGYDALTYAGNLENLDRFQDNPRFRFIKGDIGDMDTASAALAGVDVVVNFAAESHNDRGVLDPGIFLRTNVLGTQIFLEAARRCGVKRFHHISTCEVFGDLALDEDRAFVETDPYQPKTPYNASKAGANHVVMSYFHTYAMPVTISHCANNYGPYQFPEKLIPLFVTNALEDKPLPLYKTSQNKREWTHVDDHARAIEAILEKGKVGEAYNIGTGVEKTVEEITDIILQTLEKPESLKTYVPDRLGHDRRYLLDDTKLRKETGWKPEISFDEGIKETILWYKDTPEWWKRVKSGEYEEYYNTYYNNTLGKN
ncbi:MAG: dTDP-glucose 4,6-dehydratase [Candidatus Magasanikbacteria bacterium]|nr:dTDP-glucose 4,6-dehydratase [Candidatus Magasanikbacteria bacterium]